MFVVFKKEKHKKTEIYGIYKSFWGFLGLKKEFASKRFVEIES